MDVSKEATAIKSKSVRYCCYTTVDIIIENEEFLIVYKSPIVQSSISSVQERHSIKNAKYRNEFYLPKHISSNHQSINLILYLLFS